MDITGGLIGAILRVHRGRGVSGNAPFKQEMNLIHSIEWMTASRAIKKGELIVVQLET
jgi:hypothetical protein